MQTFAPCGAASDCVTVALLTPNLPTLSSHPVRPPLLAASFLSNSYKPEALTPSQGSDFVEATSGSHQERNASGILHIAEICCLEV